MVLLLITGGLGYIGSHIITTLNDLKVLKNVIIFDNLETSKIETFEILRNYCTNLNLKFINGDVTDKEKVEQVFKHNKIEKVIHLAGLKSVKESNIIPEKYVYVNVLGTMYIVETMKRYGCKNLIFSSSATVYGGDSISPYFEHYRTGRNIQSTYGDTKYLTEEYLKSNFKELNITILRYFNPIGNHKTLEIGDDPLINKNNLMPVILGNILNEKYEIDIYGNDYKTNDGTCVRDYIHVLDLAEAHVVCLMNEKSTIYNVGTGKGTSVLELITIVNKVLVENEKMKKLKYNFVGRRNGDTAECVADSTKIKNELNFECKRNVYEMCNDSLKYLKTKYLLK